MLNWGGLAGILVFYLLILGVGLWAAWKRKKDTGGAESSQDEVMLAGRNIGMFVGILTMTATWVGGGYINGSAEEVYKSGLVWTQAPFGYSISLCLGGIFMAGKMRKEGYTTMLDPLQDRLGRVMGSLLFLPALMGELCWSASILGALGTTINVIMQLDQYVGDGDSLSIIISASIVVLYTLFGGLWSVAYTDVIQLICIFIGLWVTVPFAMSHKAFSTLDVSQNDWIGTVQSHSGGVWFDYAMLLMCGGIPWQAYFQRVLSSKSPRRAQILSVTAGAGCIFMAIPAVLIGAIASGTDWKLTEFGRNLDGEDTRFVLPLVMQYMTPPWVAFIGLGAVSAAVMSSADSSVLSASTMFARNIYRNLLRPRASDREILIVMRVAIFACALIATVIAIHVKTIYGLFFLCSDLVFVILFPQLVTVVHVPRLANTYGSFLALVVGLTLRIAGGETLIDLDPAIEYWWYSKTDGQLFPFRTFSMVCSFATLIVTSLLVEKAFTSGAINAKFDFARCFCEDDEKAATGLNYWTNRADTNGLDNAGLELTDVGGGGGGGGGGHVD